MMKAGILSLFVLIAVQGSAQDQIQYDAQAVRRAAVVTRTPAEWKRIKEREQRATEEARKKKAEDQKKAKPIETAWGVRGKVIQHVGKNSLLVESIGSVVNRNGVEICIYDGTCLLVGFDCADIVADGETISTKAEWDGLFTYETVLGATRTVRRFDAIKSETKK